MKSQYFNHVIEVFYIKTVAMEWYRIFLYTAKLGNLTKAAQALHITQPSVSYAIKQLEETLGVKLFDRLSKGVNLTSEGRALFEYVEQSFALLDAGEKRIQSLRRLTAGELRIGASGPFIRHLLLPALDQFHADYPGVRIRLSQGKTADIGKRLKERQIELGLVHLPVDDPGLEVKPLLDIQDCFVVGNAYRALSGQPITTGQLAEIPLLLLSSESSTRLFVEQWLHAQGYKVEADIELNSMEMLVELARRGYGTAFVTRSFVQQELDAGQLFELQTVEPIPPRAVGIAMLREHSPSLIAARFMELLTAS
ncbi:LysR family transcriptional regulator [Paenibacillus naphthalenovorans]|uniref:LysR family transcriptional regulator n=1 Tax=Paenibacillus naphthalenovorans TaxID=162209 RepID=UPI003D299B2B